MLLVWPTNFYLENEISLYHTPTNAVNPDVGSTYSHIKEHMTMVVNQYSMLQAKRSAQGELTYVKIWWKVSF